MSRKRQTAVFDRLRSSSAPILAQEHDYAAGHLIPMHFHDRDQLVYATRGVMTVETSDGCWVVPAHRAVWIPNKVAHTIAMSGHVAMRTLYLKPCMRALLRECCVMQVSPLLHELILQACTCGSLGMRVPWQRHLVEVILDQLRAIKVAPLQLPLPGDPRALRVAEALLLEPSEARSLDTVCQKCGASRRTIERLFVEQTGMTVGKWRQQMRLLEALRLLGEGAKVTHAAMETGYSTSSAFVAAFRKAMGVTPSRYFHTSRED